MSLVPAAAAPAVPVNHIPRTTRPMKKTLLLLTLFLGIPVAASQVSDPEAASQVAKRADTDKIVGGLNIDLPEGQHLKNKGGTDGAGLCVFASMDHGARWHRIKPLIGILDWMAKNRAGGGYPEKVDKIIAERYPGYKGCIQAEGLATVTPLLDWAMKTNRIAMVTYGYSERYGQRIAHMVNLVHLDQNWAVILDNNFPGTYEIMSRQEFLRRMSLPMSGSHDVSWAYIFDEPPPPPIPTN